MIDIDRMSSLGISLPEIQMNNDDMYIRQKNPRKGFVAMPSTS